MHCIYLWFLCNIIRNPETAAPWLSLALYDEMAEEKGISLVRSDFLPNLTNQEAAVVSSMIIAAYADDTMFSFTEKFNLKPNEFNFENYLEHSKEMFGRAFTITDDDIL